MMMRTARPLRWILAVAALLLGAATSLWCAVGNAVLLGHLNGMLC
ncbi:hypothetical protein [Pseudomarimonas salicorniae]|nr:hypothetical protein [Lysobacter sp. CAU 1642]